MLELLWDVLKDTVVDGVKMLPFLFAAYLLIEYIEHKSAGRLERALKGFGRFGAVGGAPLGCVPQCGFSAAAANLYAGRVITVGTLIAVFLSTSDEAIPVLLAHPGSIGLIGKLLLVKIVIAVAAGFIIDCFFVKPASDRDTQDHLKKMCTHCHCGDHNLFGSALRHTLQIFLFIFLFSFVLNFLIGWAGEEQISRVLMQNSLLQPVIAGIFGMIPNCASSVILTELYLAGSLSFGSAVAGLSAGAGVGLAVLFKVNHNVKENIAIVVGLWVIAVICGILLQVVGV